VKHSLVYRLCAVASGLWIGGGKGMAGRHHQIAVDEKRSRLAASIHTAIAPAAGTAMSCLDLGAHGGNWLASGAATRRASWSRRQATTTSNDSTDSGRVLVIQARRQLLEDRVAVVRWDATGLGNMVLRVSRRRRPLLAVPVTRCQRLTADVSCETCASWNLRALGAVAYLLFLLQDSCVSTSRTVCSWG